MILILIYCGYWKKFGYVLPSDDIYTLLLTHRCTPTPLAQNSKVACTVMERGMVRGA